MKRLPVETRARILSALSEGCSIATTVRMLGVAENTVLSYLARAGQACVDYHDRHMVDLPCKLLQLDETWSFVGCKERFKKHAKLPHPGDVWTWIALCAETRLIPSWRVGERGMRTGYAFCDDLSRRFKGRLQITADGHPAYPWAVQSTFGDCDLAQLVKHYQMGPTGREVVRSVHKMPVCGDPDPEFISTSYVERANLTLRMHNRRFTRLTNGHSKKLENHAHMLALHFMFHNFLRRHMEFKQTPAEMNGLATRPWKVAEVVDMIEEHHSQLTEDAFEEAFAAKFDEPRQNPKTFPPTPKDQLPLPWYLDPNSDGPPQEPN